MSATKHKKIGQQGGFALLESLIAIVLFSLGILALVGLQAAMTKNVTSAKVRGEASYLANQLIGLMWVNPANLANFAIASGACANTGYANCTTWLTTVNRALPSGSANVTVNGTAVLITISWQTPGEMPSQFMIDANITN